MADPSIHYDLLFLSGQSNALGRAYNDPRYDELVPDIAYPKRSRFNPYEEAQNGTQPEHNFNEGSIRSSLVNHWVEQTSSRVSFWKMAVGGTSLFADAQPAITAAQPEESIGEQPYGRDSPTTAAVQWWETGQGNNLTDWATTEYNRYSSILAGQGATSTFRGLIWIQGENEAEFWDWSIDTQAKIDRYAAGLVKLRQDFQERLRPMPEDFPMFVPWLGSHSNPAFAAAGYTYVRQAQIQAAASDPNIHICSELPPTFWDDRLNIDTVHYGQEAMNLLGTDIADHIIDHHEIRKPINSGGVLDPLPFLFGDEITDDDALFQWYGPMR